MLLALMGNETKADFRTGVSVSAVSDGGMLLGSVGEEDVILPVSAFAPAKRCAPLLSIPSLAGASSAAATAWWCGSES